MPEEGSRRRGDVRGDLAEGTCMFNKIFHASFDVVYILELFNIFQYR